MKNIKNTDIVFFKNYDFLDDPNGPGTELFHGNMNRFKSVDEFRKSKNKRRKKMRKLLKET